MGPLSREAERVLATVMGSADDAFAIPPAHDGWVEGDEPCVRIGVAAPSHP